MKKLNVLEVNGKLSVVEANRFEKALNGETVVLNDTHIQSVTDGIKEEVRRIRKETGKRVSKQVVKTLLKEKNSLKDLAPMLAEVECKPYFIYDVTGYEALIEEAAMNGVDVHSKTALVEFILTLKDANVLVFSDKVARDLYAMPQPYGIRLTSPRGVAMRLNESSKLTYINNATTQFENIYADCLKKAVMSEKGRTVREQYFVSQVHISTLEEEMVNGKVRNIASEESVLQDVPNSSCLMLEIAKAKGYEIITLDMNIQTKEGDVDAENDRLRKVTNAMRNGFYFKGQIYRPVIQTASQSRVGKVYMVSLDTDEAVELFRHELAFKAFKEEYERKGKRVLAKDEARFGLAGTSSIGIGFYGRTNEELDAKLPEAIIPVNFGALSLEYKRDDAGKVNGYSFTKQELTENVSTDGCSFACPTWFAHVAMRLGNITKNQLSYFLQNFTTLEELRTTADKRLMNIFKAVPNVVQVRRGSTKGLIMMWDVKQYDRYKDIEIVLTDGMVKAKNIEKAEWRICNVNNKVWGKQRLSQQFMTTLNMDVADVEAMVKEQLEAIDHKVFSDPIAARKFVGAISGINDMETIGDEDDKPVVSMSTKIQAALSANPLALKDAWIQAKLFDLVQKEVMNLKYGKLLVSGIYAYNLPDPRDIFEPENALKSGQFYLNGMTKEVALLRAPNIHNSEDHVVSLVNDERLWFLSNAIIFNGYDNIAQASQGADFDGDQFLVTDNEYVIKAIKAHGPKNYFLLQGIPTDGDIKVEYSTQARLNLYITRSQRDRVGILSNYALIWGDKRNHLLALAKENPQDAAKYTEEARSCNLNIAVLAALIGAEIDYAKTGVKGEVLDFLIPKDTPSFFVHYKGEFKQSYSYPAGVTNEIGKITDKGGKVYNSKSALGVCFDTVSKWLVEMSDVIKTGGKAETISVLTVINESVLGKDIDAVRPQVTEVLAQLGRTLSDIHNRQEKEIITKEQADEARSEMFDLYKDVFGRMGDSRAVAAALYAAVNSNDGKGIKGAPWIFAFEGMISILSNANDKASVLVPLPKYATKDSVVEVYDGHLFIDFMAVAPCHAVDGDYEVINIEGKHYIDAKVDAEVVVVEKEREVYEDCPMVITGMQYCKDSKGIAYDAERIIKGLSMGYTMELIYANNKYNVVMANRVVGFAKTNASHQATFSNSLVGKELVVTGVKGQKRPITLADARGVKGNVLKSLDLLVLPVGDATSTVAPVEEPVYTVTNDYAPMADYDYAADYSADYYSAADWNC